MWLIIKSIIWFVLILIVLLFCYKLIDWMNKDIACDEMGVHNIEQYNKIKRITKIVFIIIGFVLVSFCAYNTYKTYINLPKIESNNKEELVLKSYFTTIEVKDNCLYVGEFEGLSYKSRVIDTNQIVGMECNSNNPIEYGTNLIIRYRTNYKLKNNSKDKDYQINTDKSTKVKKVEVRIKDYDQYRLIAKRVGYR